MEKVQRLTLAWDFNLQLVKDRYALVKVSFNQNICTDKAVKTLAKPYQDPYQQNRSVRTARLITTVEIRSFVVCSGFI